MRINDFINGELQGGLKLSQGMLDESSSYQDWIYSLFLAHKKTEFLHKRSTHGNSKTEVAVVLKTLEKFVKQPIFTYKHTLESIKSEYHFTDFENFKYYVELIVTKNMLDGTTSYIANVWSDDAVFADSIMNEFKPIYDEGIKSDKIYVISTSRNGLMLNSLGKLNYSFIRDNYEEKVLNSFEYVTKQFNKSNPYGRLTIMNGQPGTGKTNLLKGIISEIKNSLVILLPSKFVSDVDSPNIITLLTNEKANMYGSFYDDNADEAVNAKNQQCPILFIIEDADECLVPRGANNVSTISSLLNYTDGIFGSMLDLRIIATTNAEKVEFDDALLRPGRLCRHFSVDALSGTKASQVYKRLTDGKEKVYNKKTTLAQVYADVHGGFEDAEVEKSAPVGFGK